MVISQQQWQKVKDNKVRKLGLSPNQEVLGHETKTRAGRWIDKKFP